MTFVEYYHLQNKLCLPYYPSMVYPCRLEFTYLLVVVFIVYKISLEHGTFFPRVDKPVLSVTGIVLIFKTYFLIIFYDYEIFLKHRKKKIFAEFRNPPRSKTNNSKNQISSTAFGRNGVRRTLP